MEPWMITLFLDLALGGMAFRLARALESNLRIQTALLSELTKRVERLEEKVMGVV